MRFPDDVPVLTDGTVTLRAHRPSDVPRIVEQCNDPESLRWTTVPSPYDEEDARSWIGEAIPEVWAAGSAHVFAIEVGGEFAGSVDLRVRGGGEGELGFGLHPDARGDAVMRRALGLVLDWGFDVLGLEVVTWRAFVGNWASRRTVWGLGFSFGPTIPRLLPHRGERRDAWTAWLGRDDVREPLGRWLVPPVLEGGGVRLRPWRDDDAHALVAAGNDALVREWIPETPLPRRPEDAAPYLERVRLGHATGARLGWCVADAATDQVHGSVALFDFEDAHDEGDDATAQLGYWSLPAGRGHGTMTTALRLACGWAQRTRAEDGFGVRRVYLLTAAGNAASRRLAERAGFTHVGTERDSAPQGEAGWTDNALYDRLRSDPAPGA